MWFVSSCNVVEGLGANLITVCPCLCRFQLPAQFSCVKWFLHGSDEDGGKVIKFAPSPQILYYKTTADADHVHTRRFSSQPTPYRLRYIILHLALLSPHITSCNAVMTITADSSPHAIYSECTSKEELLRYKHLTNVAKLLNCIYVLRNRKNLSDVNDAFRQHRALYIEDNDPSDHESSHQQSSQQSHQHGEETKRDKAVKDLFGDNSLRYAFWASQDSLAEHRQTGCDFTEKQWSDRVRNLIDNYGNNDDLSSWDNLDLNERRPFSDVRIVEAARGAGVEPRPEAAEIMKRNVAKMSDFQLASTKSGISAFNYSCRDLQMRIVDLISSSPSSLSSSSPLRPSPVIASREGEDVIDGGDGVVHHASASLPPRSSVPSELDVYMKAVQQLKEGTERAGQAETKLDALAAAAAVSSVPLTMLPPHHPAAADVIEKHGKRKVTQDQVLLQEVEVNADVEAPQPKKQRSCPSVDNETPWEQSSSPFQSIIVSLPRSPTSTEFINEVEENEHIERAADIPIPHDGEYHPPSPSQHSSLLSSCACSFRDKPMEVSQSMHRNEQEESSPPMLPSVSPSTQKSSSPSSSRSSIPVVSHSSSPTLLSCPDFAPQLEELEQRIQAPQLQEQQAEEWTVMITRQLNKWKKRAATIRNCSPFPSQTAIDALWRLKCNLFHHVDVELSKTPRSQIPATVSQAYAEITSGAFEKVCTYLCEQAPEHLRMGPGSVFLDIGSGYGRCVVQAKSLARLRKSIGIEHNDVRHEKAMEMLKLHLPQRFPGLMKRLLTYGKIEFFQGDATESRFHPLIRSATHIYVRINEKH
jgi:Histone methylation protein DOT1